MKFIVVALVVALLTGCAGLSIEKTSENLYIGGQVQSNEQLKTGKSCVTSVLFGLVKLGSLDRSKAISEAGIEKEAYRVDKTKLNLLGLYGKDCIVVQGY